MGSDYSGLDFHSLDKLVAKCVLGNSYVTGSYSSHDIAVRLVRNRIAELGLISDFIGVLYSKGAMRDWDLMQTTPRQQCEAALEAVSTNKTAAKKKAVAAPKAAAKKKGKAK